MRIVAKNWENNSNNIKELENRIIAKIWSIIISSLFARTKTATCLNSYFLCAGGSLYFLFRLSPRMPYIN